MRETQALARQPLTLDNVQSSFERRPACWQHVTQKEWQSYAWQMANRITNATALARLMPLTHDEQQAIEAVSSHFGMVISPHYAAMMRPELGAACALRMQAVPSLLECEKHEDLMADPLGEGRHAVSLCATKRYPDRVMIYTTHECAMRCRHCTRRSRVGLKEAITRSDLNEAVARVMADEHVRDVLVSGGDALCLTNDRLEHILSALHACPHLDVIRLCSRLPCTMPQRILSDKALQDILRRYAPLYVNTQFNHPDEASIESAQALEILRQCGCILGNQSVLLRGINDSADILEPLNRWLLKQGCRPYYLFLCDVAQGTHHFRTSIQTGLDIMKSLRGRLSGLGIPHYVIDLPDGYGKVDLCPESRILQTADGIVTFRNWFGADVPYHDV